MARFPDKRALFTAVVTSDVPAMWLFDPELT